MLKPLQHFRVTQRLAMELGQVMAKTSILNLYSRHVSLADNLVALCNIAGISLLP